MALFLPTLTLLLVVAATAEVYGCVCYVGQEPNQATGKQYGWSLAEQRPCECTEFRLGGVNIKPQLKPFEVRIGGEDNHVSINEQGQIIQSPDCSENQQETATFEETSVCPQNTYVFSTNEIMELQLPVTSPMRLEFTVNMGDYVRLLFSTEGPSINPLCKVHLFTEYAAIWKRESSSQPVGYIQTENGVNYIGVPVIITFDNGYLEVAVQGVQDSNVTSEVTSPPQPSWFVSFQTSTEVELNFTEPCINDFNPQFTTQ